MWVNSCNVGAYLEPVLRRSSPRWVLYCRPPAWRAPPPFSTAPPGACRLAARRGVPRPTLYREADAVVRALDPRPQQEELRRLRQQLADVRARGADLERRLAAAVVLDEDRQAEFAATAQALGVSLAAAYALLRVVLGSRAPSRAVLGRLSRAAGRRAGA